MDKPKETILFPEIPELRWIQDHTTYIPCRMYGCDSLACGYVGYKDRILVYGPICREHAKDQANIELGKIADELDYKEACRKAYNLIIKR